MKAAELAEIKNQEQQKVRQQTSEDFHDDLGNKLARISALSDLLERRTLQSDDGLRDIIKKIKSNAAELYEGTRHIIWSISPESDDFYEIVLFIKTYGESLFEDTPTNFKVTGLTNNLRAVQLPYQYSRHLTMIYKEALNNVYKHAEATDVVLRVSVLKSGSIRITLSDDGRGFVEEARKYSNGIRNMQMRAKRIGAAIQIQSQAGAGTDIIVEFSGVGQYAE